MSPLLIILAALAVGASLSRLSALLYLWQIKEWRWDRLREHLRAEGLTLQLYGGIEPSLILIGFAIAILMYPGDTTVILIVLSVLNIYGIIKPILGRQRKPVWTQKALTLALVTIALTSAAVLFSLQTFPPAYIILIPILIPPLLILGWLLLKPIDILLKKYILTKAMRLRNERQNLTVIGITGSVGKTTTKELLAHIFQEIDPLVTPAHVNSDMGVAQWINKELPSHPETQLLIIEMGAYKIGEIALLCKIAQPQIGIITYIGEQHLALFGSKSAICKAKSELFASLPENGHAFANADSEMCDELLAKCTCSATTVGTGNATLTALDIEETMHGIRFKADDTVYEIPIHGTHNVTNVLLAIAAARHLGMDAATIAAKLKTFVLPHQTFEIEERNGVTILNDTYNASPASFKAAMLWACNQPHERKILLTSGIIELGVDERRIHNDLGVIAKDIFAETYMLNRKFVQDFSLGYGKKPLLLSENKPSFQPGDLLVCIGRMPNTIFEKLF